MKSQRMFYNFYKACVSIYIIWPPVRLIFQLTLWSPPTSLLLFPPNCSFPFRRVMLFIHNSRRSFKNILVHLYYSLYPSLHLYHPCFLSQLHQSLYIFLIFCSCVLHSAPKSQFLLPFSIPLQRGS